VHAHRRAVPAAVAFAVLSLAGCATGDAALEPLPPPPSTAARPPTTPLPDYRAVALPVAPGRTTTTTAVMGPGLATVRGRVVGPDGLAVVGANVRVERLVGDASARMDLVSGEDGAWSLPNVLGGRYRIRAWRAPDLAQTDPSFVYVGHQETAPVEQKVGVFVGTFAVPAIAPSPPRVGEPATLAVQVTTRTVDAEGVVRGTPRAATPVEIAGAAWSVVPPAATATDAGGQARWQVVCRAAGVQPLRLVVGGVEPFEIALPACAEPPPPPAPTTTAAPGATTTTRAGATTTTRPATTTTKAPPPATRPR
jgi:hypothetical protein